MAVTLARPRSCALFFALSASACATATSATRIETIAPDVQLLQLTDEIWVHISDDQSDRWGTIPANGLLILSQDDSLLLDTGWKPQQTASIVQFAEKQLKKPVRHVIVTHAHSDRIGGLSALTSPDVVVHVQELTVPLVEAAGGAYKIAPFVESAEIKFGQHSLELFYPGPGHSKDNTVVYFREAQILFAGCIVKSAKSADLGNREAAVITAWPLSLLKLLERYPDTELVIPGHGPPGGLNLIHHTLGLLEQELSIVTPN